MPNLLQETLAAFGEQGKTTADVRFVRNGKHVGTWDDFARLADFEYDAGYGGEYIPAGLLVVGDGWWLERHEYDGSEWWEYKSLPGCPRDPLPLTADQVGDGQRHSYGLDAEGWTESDDDMAPTLGGNRA